MLHRRQSLILSLLQRIDSISRRQHCTPTLLTAAAAVAYNVPLATVQQQHQNQQQQPRQQSIISMVRPPPSSMMMMMHVLPPIINSAPNHRSHLQSPPITSSSSSSSSSLPNSIAATPPPKSFHHHQTVSVPVAGGTWLADYLAAAFTDDERCRRTAKCVDLLASVLAAYDPQLDDFRLLLEAVQRTALVEASIYRLSVGWTLPAKVTTGSTAEVADNVNNNNNNNFAQTSSPPQMRFHHCTPVRRKGASGSICDPVVITEEEMLLLQQSSSPQQLNEAWLSERLSTILRKERHYMAKQSSTMTTANNETTEWSSIFYDCDEGRWFIAYRALILEPVENLPTGDDDDEEVAKVDSDGDDGDGDKDKDPDRGLKTWYRVKGVISAHVDVTGTDINQCEELPSRASISRKEEETKTEKSLSDLEKLLVSGSEAAVDNRRQRFQRDNARQQQQSQVPIVQNSNSIIEAELFESASSPPPQPPLLHQASAEQQNSEQSPSTSSWVVLNLYATNKCHRENSQVGGQHLFSELLGRNYCFIV
ncbi:hypothetical protein TYRP_007837 [Tyrophagus putrescentiae]|nr:hypothetical protein TYRP_007837 [Tyrophagus putrescentiae]